MIDLKLQRPEAAVQRLLLRRRWRLQCLFGAGGEGLSPFAALCGYKLAESHLPAVDQRTGVRVCVFE